MARQARYAYLDTSALVKLCWPESETAALVRFLRSWPLRVSCALLCTEAVRAAQRRPAVRLGRVNQALRRVALIDVDRALFGQAGMLVPADIRSLDAIHLAAAHSLGPDLGVVVAYDQRTIAAAYQQGFNVATPA